MATQSELAEQLTMVDKQVQKIGTEISGLKDKIAQLEAALNAGGEVSPEVQTALEAVKASVTAADDLVADVPTP